MATHALKFGQELLADRGIDHEGLLGGADHAVIKSLREDEVVDGALDLGGLVHVHRGVTRAHAQGRLAGGVGGGHHARTPGGQGQGDGIVVEQGLRGFQGGSFDPLDAVFGGAGGNRGVQHDLRGERRGLLRAGVERKNNRVAGHDGDNALKHRGGCRVGHRRHPGNHAHGLSDLDNALLLILPDNAHSAVILDGIPNIFRGEKILDALIFVEAAACFLNGGLGEHHVLINPGKGHRVHNRINLFLIEGIEFFEGGYCLRCQAIDHVTNVGAVTSLLSGSHSSLSPNGSAPVSPSAYSAPRAAGDPRCGSDAGS